MKKSEFLELLTDELKRLEEVEHVSDLAENGRYDEVDVIVSEIDYSSLDEYMESAEFEKLNIDDIPEQYVLTFAIYLSDSEYDDADVMEFWKDLSDALKKCGSAGKSLAKTLSDDMCGINAFDTFAELIAGDGDDEDEDDELEDELDGDDEDQDDESEDELEDEDDESEDELDGDDEDQDDESEEESEDSEEE